MKVQIRRVWPKHDRRVDPPRFQYANVIVRDEHGVDHLTITFDQFMATLCLQYERKSSTLEKQPPAVDLTWNERGKILDLTAEATHA